MRGGGGGRWALGGSGSHRERAGLKVDEVRQREVAEEVLHRCAHDALRRPLPDGDRVA